CSPAGAARTPAPAPSAVRGRSLSASPGLLPLRPAPWRCPGPVSRPRLSAGSVAPVLVRIWPHSSVQPSGALRDPPHSWHAYLAGSPPAPVDGAHPPRSPQPPSHWPPPVGPPPAWAGAATCAAVPVASAVPLGAAPVPPARRGRPA